MNGVSDERLLVFGSTFRVMRADAVLRSAGLPAGLSPTPRGIPSPCGLCLRLTQDHLPAAGKALAAAGLEPAPQVWRRDADTWAPDEAGMAFNRT